MKPNIGLDIKNIKGRTAVMLPITTSEIPNCLPYTVKYGKMGPDAAMKKK